VVGMSAERQAELRSERQAGWGVSAFEWESRRQLRFHSQALAYLNMAFNGRLVYRVVGRDPGGQAGDVILVDEMPRGEIPRMSPDWRRDEGAEVAAAQAAKVALSPLPRYVDLTRG